MKGKPRGLRRPSSEDGAAANAVQHQHSGSSIVDGVSQGDDAETSESARSAGRDVKDTSTSGRRNSNRGGGGLRKSKKSAGLKVTAAVEDAAAASGHMQVREGERRRWGGYRCIVLMLRWVVQLTSIFSYVHS